MREIVLYPDPRLRRKAYPIEPGSDEARALAEALEATLAAHIGVGIAAPQIGESRRMIRIDLTRAKRPVPHHGPMTLLNPEVVLREGRVVFQEGCLSIPGLVARVPRARRVKVVARGVEGEEIRLEAEGFEAVVLQHEIDHLDGILFLDRVRRARDVRVRSEVAPAGSQG